MGLGLLGFLDGLLSLMGLLGPLGFSGLFKPFRAFRASKALGRFGFKGFTGFQQTWACLPDCAVIAALSSRLAGSTSEPCSEFLYGFRVQGLGLLLRV